MLDFATYIEFIRKLSFRRPQLALYNVSSIYICLKHTLKRLQVSLGSIPDALGCHSSNGDLGEDPKHESSGKIIF